MNNSALLQYRKESGFTLVELMVVVLILGILITLALSYFAYASNKAKTNTCRTNQETLERKFIYERSVYENNNDALAAAVDSLKGNLDGAQITGLCPSGGTYTFVFKPEHSLTVFCNEHLKSDDLKTGSPNDYMSIMQGIASQWYSNDKHDNIDSNGFGDVDDFRPLFEKALTDNGLKLGKNTIYRIVRNPANGSVYLYFYTGDQDINQGSALSGNKMDLSTGVIQDAKLNISKKNKTENGVSQDYLYINNYPSEWK